jgi:hypothetical protein
VVYCIQFSDWILRADAPTAVTINNTELWNVTPCGPGYRYLCFEYTSCTHLQDVPLLKTCQTARCHSQNDKDMKIYCLQNFEISLKQFVLQARVCIYCLLLAISVVLVTRYWTYQLRGKPFCVKLYPTRSTPTHYSWSSTWMPQR